MATKNKKSAHYTLMEFASKGLHMHLQERYTNKKISMSIESSLVLIEKEKERKKEAEKRKAQSKQKNKPKRQKSTQPQRRL